METKVQPPPRLLSGAALLFWGAMTNRPLTGLLLALIVEGANWTRFRWRFDDTACSRAWRLTMSIIFIAGALIWLDGERYTLFPRLLGWIPLVLLPLQFVQSYGTRDRMPLNSFSFFSEVRRARNRRLGLSESVINFNFGNPYFVATLIAASLGKNAEGAAFFPCLVLLCGWLVFSRMWGRPAAMVSLLLFAGLLGLTGQIGMRKLYNWAYELSSGDSAGNYTDLTVSKTMIGSLGKIKQSPEMLWRIKPLKGQPSPRLLRLASFNRYKGVVWRNDLPKPLPEAEDHFRELATMQIANGEPHHMMREMTREEVMAPLPAFHMRGATKAHAPFPLPGDAATLQEFQVDDFRVNPLGTVRILPVKSIIEGIIRWRDPESADIPPMPEADLDIPDIEMDAIQRVVDELGLRDLPTLEAKIGKLRTWFAQEFEYTRYLTISPPRPVQDRPSAIELFLTEGKSGHCEYFATASILLLRAADVPARYCVGYAVMERDFKRQEYVIRGTHAHAWARAWDESAQKWVDFDATPAGWLGAETVGEPQFQWLSDTYQRLKEDFFLWRNRPANRLAATIVMWMIGLGVLVFVSRRLWKSKLTIAEKAGPEHTGPSGARTPLNELERSATRLLGPRPAGVTFASWLSGLSFHKISPQKLGNALDLHQRMRFDPAPAPSESESRLRNLAADLEGEIHRAAAAT